MGRRQRSSDGSRIGRLRALALQSRISMGNSNSRFDHVPLNRMFRELPKNASESDDSDLSRAAYVSAGLSWNELLQDYRVVILSEAGSGKTEELRATATKLRSGGKDAFFLRLENVSGHFHNAFDAGTGCSEFPSNSTLHSDPKVFPDHNLRLIKYRLVQWQMQRRHFGQFGSILR
jgi:hypothetical protein